MTFFHHGVNYGVVKCYVEFMNQKVVGTTMLTNRLGPVLYIVSNLWVVGKSLTHADTLILLVA